MVNFYCIVNNKREKIQKTIGERISIFIFALNVPHQSSTNFSYFATYFWIIKNCNSIATNILEKYSKTGKKNSKMYSLTILPTYIQFALQLVNMNL